MKTTTLLGSLLVLMVSVASSGADSLHWLRGFEVANSGAASHPTRVPLAPHPHLFADFQKRVEAAMTSHNFGEIQTLYQTNGVTTDDWKHEETRWHRLIGQSEGAKISIFYKTLNALPPTARQYWSRYAQALTDPNRKVTCLAVLGTGTGAGLVLPLVEVQGKLIIVPRRTTPEDAGTGAKGRSHERQSGRSGTN